MTPSNVHDQKASILRIALHHGEAGIQLKQTPMTGFLRTDGSIILAMDVTVNGVDDGGPIEGFCIAGENRKFHSAKAEHHVTGKDDRGRDQKDHKVLVLTSSMVPKPVHYRYAWARNPMGNLQVQGNSDIPFATQRSDGWPHGEMVVDGNREKLEGRPLQTALRALDQARKAKEAADWIASEKPGARQGK